MAVLDKDCAGFDSLSRDQKAVSALSLIMATYYIPEGTPDSERKIHIAHRLVDAYNLFRRPDRKDKNGVLTGAGTYGQTLSDKELKSSFESQYTLGNELGIWIDSKLHLSDLALKVAKLEITITEYFDIVFQNLFTYQERLVKDGVYEIQYAHFLFETLDNLDSKFEITKEKLKEIFYPRNEKNDNRNALFNFLKDTSYFIKVSEDKLCLNPIWQDRLQELKNSCNLEYRDKDRESTQKYLKDKKNYAEYVSSRQIKTPTAENVNNEANIDTSDNQPNSNHPMGKNIIYYGAPGTGKSYGISQEIKKVYSNFDDETSEDAAFVFRTTLHPEYTYTDFVGQVMPKVTDNVIKYEFIPGIFTRALAKAIKHEKEGKAVFLVLEELSRANVAAVFGDLFQLLDRKNGRSEYSITNSLISQVVYPMNPDQSEEAIGNQKIYIPRNLHILGTVNTNDQNVFVMDTAFKRRFEWKYISTKPTNNENNPNLLIINLDSSMGYIKWHDFYQVLNKYITHDMGLSEDKQVGQFFIQFNNNAEENKVQIQNKLLQYLWDDVQAASFNSKKIFNSSISNFSDLYDKFENNEIIFNEDFISRLNPYIDQSWSNEDDEA